jgi:3',5'-cyclic-nucleotide phosphodiesterase
MKLRVLGCSGGSAPGRNLTGFLLDDVLAVDAGSLTTGIDIAAQGRVEAVLLTHAHLDHSWSFPLFLANRFTTRPGTVALHGSEAAIDAVMRHLFNDEVWPHHERFHVDGVPLVAFHPFPNGTSREVLPGWHVEAVGLHHTVPTQAFLVRRRGRSLIVAGDTAETDELWALANRQQDLRGLVLECSYPSDEADLAVLTGHLTPTTLSTELAKLRHDVPVFVTHVKPEYLGRVTRELAALADPRIRILADGEVHAL